MRVARSRRLVSSGLNEKHTVTGPPLVGGWGLGASRLPPPLPAPDVWAAISDARNGKKSSRDTQRGDAV